MTRGTTLCWPYPRRSKQTIGTFGIGPGQVDKGVCTGPPSLRVSAQQQGGRCISAWVFAFRSGRSKASVLALAFLTHQERKALIAVSSCRSLFLLSQRPPRPSLTRFSFLSGFIKPLFRDSPFFRLPFLLLGLVLGTACDRSIDCRPALPSNHLPYTCQTASGIGPALSSSHFNISRQNSFPSACSI